MRGSRKNFRRHSRVARESEGETELYILFLYSQHASLAVEMFYVAIDLK